MGGGAALVCAVEAMRAYAAIWGLEMVGEKAAGDGQAGLLGL